MRANQVLSAVRAYRKMRFELSSLYCVCVSVMLIKCDKYSLGVGESNLEAEGVITLTASNATIFFYCWCG